MEPLELAGRFVDERFPLAEAVVLAGSSARGERTATSDLDLLILGPAAMFDEGADALAATFAFGGQLVEVFAYTAEGFERWALKGVSEFRPVIVHMLTEGVAVRSGAELDELRARWAPVLARGPEPSSHELRVLRYRVTDLLDDLADATDALEQRIVMAAAFERLAQVLLLTNGRWFGTGKHLARRLREWDAARADALAAPMLANDIPGFVDAARRELAASGGAVRAGLVR